MKEITDAQLIKKAKSVIKPKKNRHGETFADVGCALLSAKGNVYVGVNVGFCAEGTAIAMMITHGEYKIKTIVAVWKDGTILSPCGRCREFMYQVDKSNLNADVIIGKNKTMKLRKLLPLPWDKSWERRGK